MKNLFPSIFELIIVACTGFCTVILLLGHIQMSLHCKAYAHMCSRQLSFLAPQCVQFSASVETSEHYCSLHHGKLCKQQWNDFWKQKKKLWGLRTWQTWARVGRIENQVWKAERGTGESCVMPDMHFSAKGGSCPLLPSGSFRLCPLFEKVARGPGQQRHLPHLQESHGNGDKPLGKHCHQERPAQLQELRLHYKDPLGADQAAWEGMRVSTSPLPWQ